MGLDMYLKKKHYIGAEYEHRNVEAAIEITINKRRVGIDPNKVSEIVESAGYWRKCNQIHKWFVDNVQKGVDDCKEYYVSMKQLHELRDLCQKVLDTKDASLLPPASGFFFGSTEVDEYYFGDLQDTIKIINALKSDGDYYYRSSW